MFNHFDLLMVTIEYNEGWYEKITVENNKLLNQNKMPFNYMWVSIKPTQCLSCLHYKWSSVLGTSK